MSGPFVSVSNDRQAGSCSACDAHIVLRPPHVVPHQVFVVRTLSMEVRFCARCARLLVDQIQMRQGMVHETTPASIRAVRYGQHA